MDVLPPMAASSLGEVPWVSSRKKIPRKPRSTLEIFMPAGEGDAMPCRNTSRVEGAAKRIVIGSSERVRSSELICVVDHVRVKENRPTRDG